MRKSGIFLASVACGAMAVSHAARAQDPLNTSASLGFLGYAYRLFVAGLVVTMAAFAVELGLAYARSP